MKKKYAEILPHYRQLFIKGNVFIGEWGIFGTEVFLHYSRFFIKGNVIIGGVECRCLYWGGRGRSASWSATWSTSMCSYSKNLKLPFLTTRCLYHRGRTAKFEHTLHFLTCISEVFRFYERPIMPHFLKIFATFITENSAWKHNLVYFWILKSYS